MLNWNLRRREINGSKTVFEVIIIENFAESMKDTNLQTQESQCVPTWVIKQNLHLVTSY